MPKILMVAEKPSVASALAKHLAGSSPCRTDSGRIPSHHFDARCPTLASGVSQVCVTSVAGHLFSVDFPEAYQDWDAVDPAELFLVRTQKKCENWAVEKQLRACARGVDYVVLWLDCDREGDNICFEVLSCVTPHMRHARVAGEQQIFRAKFSALTAADIERAMGSLVEPDENASLAVDARQEIDLKVGVAFSRFQTRYFAGKYSDLNAKLISYGPCQTPALGLCVERHDAIASFRPEPYWVLSALLGGGGDAERAPIALKWQRGRVFEHGAAEALMLLVCDAARGGGGGGGGGDVTVERVEVRLARKKRPMPMNTVEMLRLASRVLGISPKDAMRCAEVRRSLYFLLSCFSFVCVLFFCLLIYKSCTCTLFSVLIFSSAAQSTCTSTALPRIRARSRRATRPSSRKSCPRSSLCSKGTRSGEKSSRRS